MEVSLSRLACRLTAATAAACGRKQSVGVGACLQRQAGLARARPSIAMTCPWSGHRGRLPAARPNRAVRLPDRSCHARQLSQL